jgi:hypothetical protein
MLRKSGRARLFTGLAALVIGMGLVSQAGADTIIFNPSGGVTTVGGFTPGNVTITSFGWGSGDALAVASITSGGIVGVGSTFQLYYQTKLTSFNNSGGAISNPAGFGASNGYQITEIATFTEVVTSLSSNAVTFGLAGTQASGNLVKIYWQDLAAAGATPANADTGSGYNPTAAGSGSKLIYSAALISNQSNYTDTTKQSGQPVQTLNPLNPANYSGVNTDQGTGSNVLNMRTLTIDTSFFIAPPGIALSQFSSNLRNNFADIGASLKFNDPNLGTGAVPSITPSVGTLNGVSGPDFLLQVSGATQNFSVPEPASISLALTALGIVPLATWHVRRRRARG